jgi:hypothetical protein
MALGDFVIDLFAMHHHGLLSSLDFDTAVFGFDTLNAYMSLEKRHWTATRDLMKDYFSEIDNSFSVLLKFNEELKYEILIPMENVTMQLPAKIGTYAH